MFDTVIKIELYFLLKCTWVFNIQILKYKYLYLLQYYQINRKLFYFVEIKNKDSFYIHIIYRIFLYILVKYFPVNRTGNSSRTELLARFDLFKCYIR